MVKTSVCTGEVGGLGEIWSYFNQLSRTQKANMASFVSLLLCSCLYFLFIFHFTSRHFLCLSPLLKFEADIKFPGI